MYEHNHIKKERDRRKREDDDTGYFGSLCPSPPVLPHGYEEEDSLTCRIQFWGDDKIVDLKAKEAQGSGSSVTPKLYRSKCDNSIAEFALVGSILNVKHYFRDMSALPLLVIDTRKNYHRDNVIGCGEVDLVTLLNNLIVALKETTKHDDDIFTSLSATNKCDENGVFANASVLVHSPIVSLKNRASGKLEQIKETMFDTCEVIGNIELRIELLILDDKGLEQEQESQTTIPKGITTYQTETYLNKSRSSGSDKTLSTKSDTIHEFGIYDDTISSMGTVPNDEEDSMLVNILFESQQVNPHHVQKINQYHDISSRQSKNACTTYKNQQVDDGYSNGAGKSNIDMFFMNSSQSTDQMIANVLDGEKKHRSLNLKSYPPPSIGEVMSLSVWSKLLSVQFAQICIQHVTFTPQIQDTLSSAFQRINIPTEPEVHIRFTIPPEAVLPSDSSKRNQTMVCKCGAMMIGYTNTNKTARRREKSINSAAHTRRKVPRKKNTAKTLRASNMHYNISHSNNFHIRLESDRAIHAWINGVIQFELLISCNLTEDALGSTKGIHRDFVIGSAELKLCPIFYSPELINNQTIEIKKTGEENVIISKLSVSMKLLQGKRNNECMKSKKPEVNEEGIAFNTSTPDLGDSSKKSYPSTASALDKVNSKDSSVSIRRANPQYLWMHVELSRFIINYIPAPFIVTTSSAAKIKIRISYGLAVASMNDVLDLGRQTSKLKATAFKEKVIPISVKLNEDESQRICNNDMHFVWKTPLKIFFQSDNILKLKNEINCNAINIELFIQDQGKNVNEDFSVLIGKSVIKLSYENIQKNSSSHLPSLLYNEIITFGQIDANASAKGLAKIFVGHMKSVQDLPKMTFAVQMIQKWWTEKTKSLQQINPKWQKSISNHNGADTKRMDPPYTDLLEEKVVLLQQAWRGHKGSHDKLVTSSINSIHLASSVVTPVVVEMDKRRISSGTLLVKKSNTWYNVSSSNNTKQKLHKSAQIESIRNTSMAQPCSVNLLQNGTNERRTVRHKNETEMVVRIGPVCGIHEILMLWLDNEETNFSSTASVSPQHHEFISSGIMISFKFFTKIPSESKYLTRICSSEIICVSQLNRRSIDFKTNVVIDESVEMLNYLSDEQFECILWFIPVITTNMQQRFPSSIIDMDQFETPQGSKQVCCASCPMKCILSPSTAKTTYKCPWKVCLSKDSQDFEYMGFINVTFHRLVCLSKLNDAIFVSLCSSKELLHQSENKISPVTEINRKVLGEEGIEQMLCDDQQLVCKSNTTIISNEITSIKTASFSANPLQDSVHTIQNNNKRNTGVSIISKNGQHEGGLDIKHIVGGDQLDNMDPSKTTTMMNDHFSMDGISENRNLSSVMESLDAITAKVCMDMKERSAIKPIKCHALPEIRSSSCAINRHSTKLSPEAKGNVHKTLYKEAISSLSEVARELEGSFGFNKILEPRMSPNDDRSAFTRKCIMKDTERNFENNCTTIPVEIISHRVQDQLLEDSDSFSTTSIHDMNREVAAYASSTKSIGSTTSSESYYPIMDIKKNTNKVKQKRSCHGSTTATATATATATCTINRMKKNYDTDSSSKDSSSFTGRRKDLQIQHPTQQLVPEEDSLDSSDSEYYYHGDPSRLKRNTSKSSRTSSSTSSYPPHVDNVRVARIMGLQESKSDYTSEDDSSLNISF
jgi:hypothetical protein